MRGAARTTCWRSASPPRARITSSPSTPARSWRPALDGAIPAAWAIAEMLKPANKPLDIQVTATDNGLDVDVRGSGPLDAGAHGRARARRRHAQARPPHPPRRTGGAKRAADAASRPRPACRCRPAPSCRRPPKAKRRWRGWCSSMSARPSASPICSAASALSPCGWPSAPASPPPTATRPPSRRSSARPRRRSGLKPVEAVTRDLFRRPLVASELKAFDAVVFDPPRQGAEAPGARTRQKHGAARGGGVVRRDDLRARRRALVDGGYRLAAVTPVDQFRYSYHVEIVAKFTR